MKYPSIVIGGTIDGKNWTTIFKSHKKDYTILVDLWSEITMYKHIQINIVPKKLRKKKK